MKKNIRVLAPATVSNVGPGFDIMGFALNFPVEEMIITLTNKPEIKIKKISGDKNKLPFDITKNTATVAIKKMLDKLNLKIGVELEINKKLNSGSGLGSSAASAVASVFGLNELLNNPFSKNDLLDFALQGEAVASGSIHADNVAPCLFGGFILIRSYNPIDLIKIKSPKNLFCTILHPQFAIKTSEARKLIKKNYSLQELLTQTSNAASLVNALLKSDFGLLKRSLNDVVAEPARAKLIPGFYEIKNSAIENGALGCSISGSGPSIFAFSKSIDEAIEIGNVMKIVSSKFTKKNIVYVSSVNNSGPEVI
ncbi:MAG: homoserine kinase [Melioribacteraceae bacterium]|nr:homoserine kinase [Melioribacteraceae bacterium]